LRRSILVGAIALVLSILIAAPVFAHECINASKKNQAAGAQIVFGPDDQVLFITEGLQSRIEQGVVDFETGEGFHGLIAFDVDGDGVADASTWIGVGPEGEIPLEAQFRGPACRGLTNIGIYFEQCVGA
jgi:hypothetical protein